MDEFYQDLLEPVVYRWVKTHSQIKVCEHKCTLCIDSDDYIGTISFHDEGIVELSVKEYISDEVVFYLHFQMHDFKSTIEQFNTFFNYLTTPVSINKTNIFNKNNTNRILLSCSGGLTTSYFAYSIQEIFEKQGLNIKVAAVGYMEIERVIDDYDIVLLAPQVAYMLPALKHKYGSKILMIDSMDFATSNFTAIIEKAIS